MTLNDVLSFNLSLNILIDEQIINSFRFEPIKVSDLKIIPKLTNDKNRFDQMMELFERFVDDN